MAIPWLVVLQSVPWTDVVRNAPRLADGAKTLWNTIAGKPPLPEAEAAGGIPAGLSGDPAVVKLQKHIAALEAATADLHAQMLASSELIKALADQNTQLIARIEANRVRVRRLTAALVGVGVIAVSALALMLMR